MEELFIFTCASHRTTVTTNYKKLPNVSTQVFLVSECKLIENTCGYCSQEVYCMVYVWDRTIGKNQDIFGKMCSLMVMDYNNVDNPDCITVSLCANCYNYSSVNKFIFDKKIYKKTNLRLSCVLEQMCNICETKVLSSYTVLAIPLCSDQKNYCKDDIYISTQRIYGKKKPNAINCYYIFKQQRETQQKLSRLINLLCKKKGENIKTDIKKLSKTKEDEEKEQYENLIKIIKQEIELLAKKTEYTKLGNLLELTKEKDPFVLKVLLKKDFKYLLINDTT